MSMLRRVMYMGLGAALALAIAIAGVAAFAQDGGQDEVTPVPESEVESGTIPWSRSFRSEQRAFHHTDDERLAEALGITVDELEAAQEEALAAAIEQAVAEGRLSEEQAGQLLEGLGRSGRHGHLFGASSELLAEALGISVEELQAAQVGVQAAKLADMVEAGMLTQEEADLMAAREAVQNYIDQEALSAALQNAYEEAVATALADGAITQAQADQLLENIPSFGFGSGFSARGRGHHQGFGMTPRGFSSSTTIVVPDMSLDA
jgi:polyhydroxyalkanoate synthesis regulator phasin